METYGTRDSFTVLFRMLSPPVANSPPDLAQALMQLPEPYLVPTPWATWLLVALVGYYRRQKWVRRVIRHHAPHAIPPSPELQAHGQPVALDFTGTGAWATNVELECHCEFGRATNSVGADIVTFGLSQRTDGIFFVDSLFRSFSSIPVDVTVLERFRELHPSELAIWYGISDLESAGLLEGIFLDQRHEDLDVAPDAYRLSAAAVWHLPLFERFCQRWEDTQQRLWLAASIGDWLKAHELAERTGADLLAVTGPRAEWQRREREERALRSIATGGPAEVDRCVLRDLKQVGRQRVG